MWQSHGAIRIFAYHALRGSGQAILPASWSPSHTVPVEAFRTQLRFLRDNDWQTIVPEDVDAIADARSHRYAILTFDDGHKSDAVAAELMAIHGYRAVFYIPLAHVDQTSFLDKTEIKKISAQGFVIGSHGLRHYPLTQLRESELKDELRQSKEALEDLTAKPVRDLAVPFGRYDRRVVAIALAVGYERIVTSDIGLARSGGSRVFPRLPVTARTTDHDFERLLSVGSTRLRALRYSRAIARRWPSWRSA